jgi:hypothetical protein
VLSGCENANVSVKPVTQHTHVQEKTSKLPAAIQNKAEYQHDEDDRGY